MTIIALIDYGSGNLRSVRRALEAANMPLSIYTGAEPEQVAAADKIILPGVGHFAACMARLTAINGLIEALELAVLHQGKPFLGICVGMQILTDYGTEDGKTTGLGWIGGQTQKLDPGPDFPIPHMGWNEIQPQNHVLFANMSKNTHMYFAHSYAVNTSDHKLIAAKCEYGESFIAAIARDNIFATQFHPEKSQSDGLRLLANFLHWQP